MTKQTIETKTCRECKTNQEITKFKKSNRSRDGHTTLCKVCYNQRRRDENALKREEKRRKTECVFAGITRQQLEKIKAQLSQKSKPLPNGCIEWTGSTNIYGYGQKGFLGKNMMAHRVSFMCHHEREIEQGKMLCHSCNNSLCINPLHLREGTAKDNAEDRVLAGTTKRGSQHFRSQIDEETAKLIIASKGNGKTRKERAAEFNTTYSVVASIDLGISWHHLQPEEKIREHKHEKRIPTTEDYEKVLQRIRDNCEILSEEEGGHWIYKKDVNTKYHPKISFFGSKVNCHRVSHQCFNKKQVDEGNVVRHMCKEKRCVNPKHLKEGTQKENMADKLLHGTQPRGSRHHNTKLTEDIVRKIKLSSGVMTPKERARLHGVNVHVIYGIDYGKSWTHVEI
jgi:hypothetical protein